jgi:superfamily II DNA/RNA helicase
MLCMFKLVCQKRDAIGSHSHYNLREEYDRKKLADSTVIVGTSCAGTGIDNQDVKNIVVVGLPYSVEQLLQWAGRCRCNGTVHLLVTEYSLREDTELTSTVFLVF